MCHMTLVNQFYLTYLMIRKCKFKSGAMHAGTYRHYALTALAAHQHKQS